MVDVPVAVLGHQGFKKGYFAESTLFFSGLDLASEVSDGFVAEIIHGSKVLKHSFI